MNTNLVGWCSTPTLLLIYKGNMVIDLPFLRQTSPPPMDKNPGWKFAGMFCCSLLLHKSAMEAKNHTKLILGKSSSIHLHDFG